MTHDFVPLFVIEVHPVRDERRNKNCFAANKNTNTSFLVPNFCKINVQKYYAERFGSPRPQNVYCFHDYSVSADRCCIQQAVFLFAVYRLSMCYNYCLHVVSEDFGQHTLAREKTDHSKWMSLPFYI